MQKDSSKHIAYMSFFWNAMYAGFNAIQSAIILFVIARSRELADAGIITIGFTISTLVMIIARFGIRNYQVTDVNEEYAFSDYFHVRVITVAGSLAFTVIYLIGMLFSGNYSFYKCEVVILIVILKLVDAFEGLYVGRFQQKGRLDVGAKIASIRIIVSTAVICASLWFINSVAIAFLLGFIISVLVDLILIPFNKSYADLSVKKPEGKKIGLLIAATLSLCIGTALHNYIGNAPKYLVDFFLSDEMQAISGYIMMPMFVITVLNSFLMQPMVKGLGDAWQSENKTRFWKMSFKHIIRITVLSIAVLVLGIYLGLPILSWMYKVDLTIYRAEFVLIMIGGTIYTLSAYAIVLLTTMRKQLWVVIGCGVSLVVYLAFGKMIVSSNGMLGAAQIYVISNIVLLVVFAIGIVTKMKKNLYKE